MFFNREPKVRLSDVAALTAALKEIFQAGVDAANPGPPPEQYMLTPDMIAEMQKQMEADAAFIVNGGTDDGPPEDD